MAKHSSSPSIRALSPRLAWEHTEKDATHPKPNTPSSGARNVEKLNLVDQLNTPAEAQSEARASESPTPSVSIEPWSRSGAIET